MPKQVKSPINTRKTNNKSVRTVYKTRHTCSQKEVINSQKAVVDRMSLILVGNGKPEEGLAFRFSKFMDNHDMVMSDINDIKVGVEKLHTRADDNARAAATAISAIERYKAEINGEEKAKKEIESKELISKTFKATQSKDKWQKVIWVVMGIIAIISIWVSIWLNNKENSKLEKEILTNRVENAK